jgi:hypothetical protein
LFIISFSWLRRGQSHGCAALLLLMALFSVGYIPSGEGWSWDETPRMKIVFLGTKNK